MKVIINADDFGIRKETDQLIISAIKRKLISSATILANGNDFENAVTFAKDSSIDASFGVHLNLTSFKSLTNSPVLRNYGIIDNKGEFTGGIRAINHFNNYLLDAVYKELHTQIDIIQESGVSISHADSHHHIHSIRPLQNTICRVLDDCGIDSIRLAEVIILEEIREMSFLRKVRSFVRKIECDSFNKKYSSLFRTVDFFWGISKFSVMAQKYDLSRLNNSIIELMCHMGNSHLDERNIVECELIRKVIPYELITYKEI